MLGKIATGNEIVESFVAMGDHIPSDGQPANETRQRGDFEDGCVRQRGSDTRSLIPVPDTSQQPDSVLHFPAISRLAVGANLP